MALEGSRGGACAVDLGHLGRKHDEEGDVDRCSWHGGGRMDGGGDVGVAPRALEAAQRAVQRGPVAREIRVGERH